MVFEGGFELCREINEGFHGDDSSHKGSLPEGGCPGIGSSLSNIGESEGDFLSLGVIDFLIYCEVEFN